MNEKILEVITFIHSKTLDIGIYTPGDERVTDMYDDAKRMIEELLESQLKDELSPNAAKAAIITAIRMAKLEMLDSPVKEGFFKCCEENIDEYEAKLKQELGIRDS